MSEEIKTELNEDETVCPPYPKIQPTHKTYAQTHAKSLRELNLTIFSGG